MRHIISAVIISVAICATAYAGMDVEEQVARVAGVESREPERHELVKLLGAALAGFVAGYSVRMLQKENRGKK